jgi:hypothetical protein
LLISSNPISIIILFSFIFNMILIKILIRMQII